MKQALFLISLFMSLMSFGQRDVVGAGGEASGSGGTVSFSVGQVAYQTQTGSNGALTQGVQQPFEIYVLSTPETVASFSAMLYPNPAATSVILSANLAAVEGPLDYELTDITGKIIKQGRLTETETIINVEGYAEACYFINVLEGNKRIKTFKLIKNN